MAYSPDTVGGSEPLRNRISSFLGRLKNNDTESRSEVVQSHILATIESPEIRDVGVCRERKLCLKGLAAKQP